MTSVNFETTPPSIVRLVSVIYRFNVPRITRMVSFVKSFKTVGSASQTRALMSNADDARNNLYRSCETTATSSERVIEDAGKYHPLIKAVLVSCSVQPEQARLDEKLIFEWQSGIESKPIPYKSEVMMFDFVMTLAALGMAHAVSATENSIAGQFAASSRDYSAAAGVFHLLADEQLPKWNTKGKHINEEFIPLECHSIMVKGLSSLFMANGQQMAIATLLTKEGKRNYSLLSKLCFGVAEQLEQFLSLMKGKAPNQLRRMDTDFVALTNLQVFIQKTLSLYYHARALWSNDEHGVAIAMLSEAYSSLHPKQKNGKQVDGIPELLKLPALKHLEGDIKDLKEHIALLQRIWEKDNSCVYFSSIPKTIPDGKYLKEGLQMKKKTDYVLKDSVPVLLSVPKYSVLNLHGFLKKTVQ